MPLFSWLYDVELDDRGIRFKLFFILFYHLPFENIERTREIGSFSLGDLNAYNFKNRLFARTFLIELRRGWFARKVLVTPKDADDFLFRLRRYGVQVN
ncbi:hypothetical protein [Xanthomonas oryzae]|uniref:hypothetical protein n=1 Tax=Xanthomonas oryzae TaxID=347 RepID=UPI001A92116F|nr:hypothetical protein [Xanthomonas oryzae]